MDAYTPETMPLLFKDGKRIRAVAVADPSITLVEVGDNWGYLLSESCYDSMMGSRLHFEQVNWVRRKVGKRRRTKDLFARRQKLTVRSFSEVMLYRHALGYFVVQDTQSKGYFPWPSLAPYVVVFISEAQYEDLHKEIEEEAFEQLLELVKSVSEDLPEFTFDGDTLTGPPEYAGGLDAQLDYAVMEA